MFLLTFFNCFALDTRFCECDESKLGDGICDIECMTFNCGFDSGQSEIF